eukprot:62119-Pyramimonas_sp.AAC.1
MAIARIAPLTFLLLAALNAASAAPLCVNPVERFDPLVQYFPTDQQLVATDLDLEVTSDGKTTVRALETEMAVPIKRRVEYESTRTDVYVR